MSASLTMRALIVVALSSMAAWGQRTPGPKGMYNGGNQLIQYDDPIWAAQLVGTVSDTTGARLPEARIQVQIQGSDSMLVDITADEGGRFRLPKLGQGNYWLGISTPGFNLHVWDLRIRSAERTKKLKAELSVGT